MPTEKMRRYFLGDENRMTPEQGPGLRNTCKGMGPRPAGDAPSGSRDLLRLIATGLFFTAFAVILHSDLAREMLKDPQHFKQMIMLLGDGGPLGLLIFVLSGAALMAVGIPRLWISALAGAIFGIGTGFVLATAATLLGAAGAYGIGRGILSDVVERRLGVRLTVWKQRFRENAFWWVLYGRLFPFSNSTLYSLICGSCRVSFWSYLAATLIGFLPLTIVFNAFGSGALRGSGVQIAIGFAAIVLTLGARWAVERIRNRHFQPSSLGQ
jgi:uncharacterized membrane protein YdjX (TVP38/TMEM64 family)